MLRRPNQTTPPPSPPTTTTPVLQPSNTTPTTVPASSQPTTGTTVPAQTGTMTGFQTVTDANGVIIGYIDAAGNFVPVGSGGSQQAQRYFPPPRPSNDPAFAPAGWTSGWYQTDKQGIVNQQTGKFLTDNQGNPRNYTFSDAVNEYSEMPTNVLNAYMTGFERKGLPVDDGRSQIQSLWYVMELANERGIDWQSYLVEFENVAPDVASNIAAPRYTISNPSDISTVAKRVSKGVLGRELNEEELQRFIASYQQTELQYQQQRSGVVQTPPNMEVAAAQFAEQAAPTEADAYKYLGAVDMLMRNIGEL
jgi:hypothetical protein